MKLTFHYPDTPPAPALVARLTDTQPASILFSVCSWHTPQAELDALNRQHPGQVSHALCPACSERLLHEVA